MSIGLYRAKDTAVDSFTAEWSEVAGAAGNLFNVATDFNFSSHVAGYDNKDVTDMTDIVTGLSDKTRYFFKVNSYTSEENGTAESGTASSLTDTNKAWTVDQFAGMIVRITGGTGIGEFADITANTANTLTASFSVVPDATSVYEIINITDSSAVNDTITGFSVSATTIELANIIADVVNVSSIAIEVSTDFNFEIKVKNTDNIYLPNVDCLIIKDAWNAKGLWNPNTDPDPATPSEGDYYTISADGVNDITGEDILFTTADLLLYESSAWVYKRSRNLTTNSEGLTFGFIDYNVDNCIHIDHQGYQIENQCVNKTSGEHSIIMELHKIVSAVVTKRGAVINLDYKNRTSNSFS